MVESYEIQASVNGKDWKHITTFYKGDSSRFGEPFNYDIAMKEANSFRDHRYKEWPCVRVIITLCDKYKKSVNHS